MGVAAWRVWRAYGFDGARNELILYGVQLALNAAWSWFFFVRRSGLLATIEVSLLLTAVISTAVAFGARESTAGWLFVPYVCWVSFATALTVAVWRRNPNLL
jgi:tryptophan-rich sensory protein